MAPNSLAEIETSSSSSNIVKLQTERTFSVDRDWQQKDGPPDNNNNNYKTVDDHQLYASRQENFFYDRVGSCRRPLSYSSKNCIIIIFLRLRQPSPVS